ncbi:hypothetical protein PHMEG_0006027 [Phytophthora megakarya]|uniref:Uncharacterized protein n=1 Tax=Phytophthora megakarya TaxID=4795 RepID=A0A225WPW1_9STRA|nr:hypothetical protein PHMEG_0006027 [Phytophthora megakarya]
METSPYTNDDLKKMMHLYMNTSTLTDYQEAGLLRCKVFFIRFIRVKTSAKQARSHFPDEAYATCQLLTLALALITQAAPCAALLCHLIDEVRAHCYMSRIHPAS